MVPNHLLLHQHLQHSAVQSPDKTAVNDGTHSITYSELDAWAWKGAAALRAKGVVPGDRVVLFLHNSTDFVKSYWAALYAGGVVTPVSADLKREKLGYILGDCTPKAVITDTDNSALLSELAKGTDTSVLTADFAADFAGGDCPADNLIDQDLGCIIYTSGSTGNPKGVMLSHQNLVTASRSVRQYLGYTAQDKIFVTIPLTFDYGMHQLTMAALVGASVEIERDFSKPLFALHRVQTSGATAFPVVPTMVPLIAKLAGRFDLSQVRLLSSTAAALDPKMIDTLTDTFPQAQVFSMYGLTECHRCTYVPPSQLQAKKSSVGIAIPNTQLWVVDNAGEFHKSGATGELVIRGATVMKGYWNNPEKTAQYLKPGFFAGEYVFHTGDICRLDEDGFVYFVSRKDDIIKVKGEKVAPKEVEDVLRRNPSVTEAIVYGAPDPITGDSVHAAVTLQDGSNATPDTLRAWCAEHLEPVAVPRKVTVWEAFGLTANGKIDRTQFKSSAAQPRLSQPQKEMT